MTLSSIGLHKKELDTPCLIIDKSALEYNLKLMQEHGTKKNINIRPHCKTHKCSKLAQLQMQFGSIGVCAAKISEAAVLIDHGITNVLVTSPVVTPQKIKTLLRCVQKDPALIVVVDNEQNLKDLHEAALSINTQINVLVDVDSGIGRTGVDAQKALAFAQQITQLHGLNLLGIQCYAGNLQHVQSFDERRKRSLEVMNRASELLNTFRAHGLNCPILTGTGTGTFDIDCEASEVTEIQPGSYAVMDVEYSVIEGQSQESLGHLFKPAMTLLTTVISSNRAEHVTVDAGTKAIYFDVTNKPQVISHEGLLYNWGGFGDEHGKITAQNEASLPTNGEVLELIVPHCDPTINLYDRFFIVEDDRVADVWDIDLRGKCQ